MRARLLLLTLAGCWTSASVPPPQEVPVTKAPPPDAAVGPLRVELAARPTSFALAERDRFVLAWTVTNTSDAPLDPKLDFANLRVNGEPSVMFANTIGNAGGEPEWYALPPGAKVERAWPMGRDLFEKPGDYTLVLEVSGILSAPVTIRVSP